MFAIATELFARKGYKAVSIREIARKSGVTLSSLYHHFGDKRQLYIQVHLKEFEKSSARLEAAIAADGNAAQKLLAFTTELCRVLSDPGPLFRLVARHYIEGEPDVVRSLAQATVPEQFRRTRAAIHLLDPERDATALTLSLYSLVHGHITLQPFAASIARRSGIPRAPQAMAAYVLSLLLPDIRWCAAS